MEAPPHSDESSPSLFSSPCPGGRREEAVRCWVVLFADYVARAQGKSVGTEMFTSSISMSVVPLKGFDTAFPQNGLEFLFADSDQMFHEKLVPAAVYNLWLWFFFLDIIDIEKTLFPDNFSQLDVHVKALYLLCFNLKEARITPVQWKRAVLHKSDLFCRLAWRDIFSTTSWTVDVSKFVPSYEDGLTESAAERAGGIVDEGIALKLNVFRDCIEGLRADRVTCRLLHESAEISLLLECLETKCEELEAADPYFFTWNGVELEKIALAAEKFLNAIEMEEDEDEVCGAIESATDIIFDIQHESGFLCEDYHADGYVDLMYELLDEQDLGAFESYQKSVEQVLRSKVSLERQVYDVLEKSCRIICSAGFQRLSTCLADEVARDWCLFIAKTEKDSKAQWHRSTIEGLRETICQRYASKEFFSCALVICFDVEAPNRLYGPLFFYDSAKVCCISPGTKFTWPDKRHYEKWPEQVHEFPISSPFAWGNLVRPQFRVGIHSEYQFDFNDDEVLKLYMAHAYRLLTFSDDKSHRISALLVSAEGSITGWAVNLVHENRLAHAETILSECFGVKHFEKGARVFTTLQSCRWCSYNLKSRRHPGDRGVWVYYGQEDSCKGSVLTKDETEKLVPVLGREYFCYRPSRTSRLTCAEMLSMPAMRWEQEEAARSLDEEKDGQLELIRTMLNDHYNNVLNC